MIRWFNECNECMNVSAVNWNMHIYSLIYNLYVIIMHGGVSVSINTTSIAPSLAFTASWMQFPLETVGENAAQRKCRIISHFPSFCFYYTPVLAVPCPAKKIGNVTAKRTKLKTNCVACSNKPISVLKRQAGRVKIIIIIIIIIMPLNNKPGHTMENQ